MLNNWQNIHHGFINELQQKWQTEGFTHEQVKRWINIGLKPTDYKLATYIRYTLGYEPEEALNFADLETLRVIYQESLNEQFENLQIQRPTIREPETIIDDEPVPEIPPQQPTLQEELELTRGLALSLGLVGDDDDSDSSSSSSSEEEEEINLEELEKYLSDKRLELKKYFPFNIQELTTEKARDDLGNVSRNGRVIIASLADDLTTTALANGWDDNISKDDKELKKNILVLNKENGASPSMWECNDLDKQIKDKKELYIILLKDGNWVDWKGRVNNVIDQSSMVNARVKPSLYLKSKPATLRFLKNNDPALSGKNNLYEWWKEKKKLTDTQKERLVKIGIEDKKGSSDNYKFEELERILKYEDIAKQNTDELPFEKGEIKKIILFSPPRFQDKDCAVVVSKKEQQPQSGIIFPLPFIVSPLILEDLSAEIWLLVYEEPWKKIGNGLYAKKLNNKLCRNLNEAEEKANILVNRLMNRNNSYPACAVFDKVGDVFEAFSFVGDIKGVGGFKIPWNAKSNPEGYFKPLDIVRVENPFYSHAGVYLGKDKNGKHKVAQVTKKNNGLHVTDWRELFGDNSSDLSRYHPFITYKKPRLIRKHIARAYSSGAYNGAYALLFGTSDYRKGNCQQFANRTVLGLNITNEGTLFKKNRLLKEEIIRTNQHFDNLKIIGNDRRFYWLVRRGIRGFAERVEDKKGKQKLNKEGEQVAQIIHNPQWKWKQTIELKPSENCKIQ